MSILKLAPAAVTQATSEEAVRRLIAADTTLAADSRYLFSQNAEHGSMVVSGDEAGKSLADYINEKGWAILGTDAQNLQMLPFTIRDLGVESGELFYSADKKNQSFWYVSDAPEGSAVYFGMKGSVTPDELEAALKDGSYKTKLEAIDIAKDDLLVVEPGTVYVFEKGPKILEIERKVPENTDGFQAEEGSEAVKHDYHKGDWVADGQAEHVSAGRNDVFELDLFQLDGRMDMDTDEHSFKVLVFLDGTAVVDDHQETIHCQQDSVLFVPAHTEPFHITGNAKFALVHLV